MSQKKREDKGDWRDGLPAKKRHLHMLENGIGTDCSFVVGPEDGETKEFKAHRLFLCNASAVFEKMLTGEMSEAKTGHVRVTDLSPNSFHLLLRFVYADEAEMSTFEEAHDVALAADKYQMKLLFEQSLSNMRMHVSYKNVWTALKFLRLLPHKPLKQACVKVMQEDTRKCVDAKEFVQADEEDVALLLEQDVLNVESELVLLAAAVTWAKHEAQRRGAGSDNKSVRAVLEPRLLSLLRLLTIPPANFAKTFANVALLTTEEKWAIIVCIHTENCSTLPKNISASLIPRKTPTSGFRCQRKVLMSMTNFRAIHEWVTSIFRVKAEVECKLLGFQIRSQVLSDATKLGSTEHTYDETLKVFVYNCGRSLLLEMFREERLVEFEFTERVAYNSILSVFFPQPVVLNRKNWFKIAVVLKKSGDYPNAHLETNVVCPDVPGEVEFEFHTTKSSGYLNSSNDGLVRALIFSL